MIMEKVEKVIVFKEDVSNEFCELSKKLYDIDVEIKNLEALKTNLKAKLISLGPDEDYTFIDQENKYQICCYKQNKTTKTLNKEFYETLPAEVKSKLYIEKTTLMKLIMSKPLQVKEKDLDDKDIDKESI